MLLNERLNDTTQKILWAESVQTCERVSNSMVKTGITKSPFEVFLETNPISLVLYQSLDVFPTSRRGKMLRYGLRTRFTRKKWLDMLK